MTRCCTVKLQNVLYYTFINALKSFSINFINTLIPRSVYKPDICNWKISCVNMGNRDSMFICWVRKLHETEVFDSVVCILCAWLPPAFHKWYVKLFICMNYVSGCLFLYKPLEFIIIVSLTSSIDFNDPLNFSNILFTNEFFI